MLGQVAYDALVTPVGGGNLYSRQALEDPDRPAVSLSKDFLMIPELRDIVAETHFQPGDRDPQGRMGRLIAFMANMAAGDPAVAGRPRSIAASWGTAVLVRWDGTAFVADIVGNASAYFVKAPDTVPLLADGQPLSWQDIEVIKVGPGGTFNLDTWAGDGRRYLLDVIDGRLAVEGNPDFY